jgi:DNA-binding NtrC family response regulator
LSLLQYLNQKPMGMTPDLKIFLVDDEPYCLDLYGQYLRNLGYVNVQYFNKSADCLDQLTLQPELIFLDYNMDNLNGIDVLKKIKRFDPNILIVFLSGQKEIAIAVNALKYGALDYIGKEDVDEQRIGECMSKVVRVKETLSNGGRMQPVKKILAGVGVFSALFFFQKLFIKYAK